MTTIAYKDGHVSYDSQATRGNTRTNIEHNKKYTCEGYTFFFSGTVRTIPEFIEKFFEGTEAKKIDNTCAFVVSPEGDVFLAGFDSDGSVWHDPVPYNEYYAIGSGSEFAIGAMDAGCSAKDAVKIACGRDVYSGGRIRTFKI